MMKLYLLTGCRISHLSVYLFFLREDAEVDGKVPVSFSVSLERSIPGSFTKHGEHVGAGEQIRLSRIFAA